MPRKERTREKRKKEVNIGTGAPRLQSSRGASLGLGGFLPIPLYISHGMCYTETMQPRIVAFDIGDRRIGVAVSDPFNEYAMPLDTYFRTGNLQEDISALLSIAEEKGAGTIVCGLPLNADGTRSIQTEKTERLIAALTAQTSLPVLCEDERNTTREARADLLKMGISQKRDKQKKNVDSLAAAYILESYLAKTKKGDTNMNMKEDYNDYEDDENIVELVDEEGNKERFEHIGTVEYKGEWYACFTPEARPEERGDEEDEEDEGEEVVIFHIVGEENDEHLETIEDDALLDEVFAEFCNQYGDSEDADEAALLDGEEE